MDIPVQTVILLADGDGIVLLGVVAIIVIGGLVGLWYLSRFAPRGATLLFAVAIYVLGVAVGASGGGVRELLLVSGSMKLLGFAGGILGLVDALKSREPKNQGPPPIVGIPTRSDKED